jgi:hypothetical protein
MQRQGRPKPGGVGRGHVTAWRSLDSPIEPATFCSPVLGPGMGPKNLSASPEMVFESSSLHAAEAALPAASRHTHHHPSGIRAGVPEAVGPPRQLFANGPLSQARAGSCSSALCKHICRPLQPLLCSVPSQPKPAQASLSQPPPEKRQGPPVMATLIQEGRRPTSRWTTRSSSYLSTPSKS